MSDDPLAEYLFKQVVVDIGNGFVVFGTLAEASAGHLLFTDCDLHDQSEANSSREIYAMESRDIGIEPIASACWFRETVDRRVPAVGRAAVSAAPAVLARPAAVLAAIWLGGNAALGAIMAPALFRHDAIHTATAADIVGIALGRWGIVGWYLYAPLVALL